MTNTTYREIRVDEVVEGMQILIEIGPGDEAWPMVREVVTNDDGSISFDMTMLGMVDGWKNDEMVAVQV